MTPEQIRRIEIALHLAETPVTISQAERKPLLRFFIKLFVNPKDTDKTWGAVRRVVQLLYLLYDFRKHSTQNTCLSEESLETEVRTLVKEDSPENV